ncbi:MAG: phosphoserine transaminase, partial [Actinomycetes bacterium]
MTGVGVEAAPITIPSGLRPADGRFGSGPSKVRPEAVAELVATGGSYLGTSHRRPGVRQVVNHIRRGLLELFDAPEGYEVLLGNGGSSAFWDAATFGLISSRSQHLSFGEFSAKFATAAERAPHLGIPTVISSEPGTHPLPVAEPGVDTYALTQNETSTGVVMPVTPVPGADPGSLVVVDATSAAGGVPVDVGATDAYYFAPQKCFGSDGGLWLALFSPAAVERVERIRATGRWAPAFLDLGLALENSRANQTYNTPALATLALLDAQLAWMLDGGGLAFAAGRSAESARRLYGWAEQSPYAHPFVADPVMRSPVVGTIDLDDHLDATRVAAVLRANG